jgi:CRISPR/Cas system-associated endonuclease Cas1
MRERCPRPQQIGEVCGTKLVHAETSSRIDKSCKICEAIETKQRRLRKAQELIAWRRKNGEDRFQNSIARAKEEVADMLNEIRGLESKRESAKSSRLAAGKLAAAGARSSSGRFVSNGRAWEPTYDCRSPTAEMMSRLPHRW